MIQSNPGVLDVSFQFSCDFVAGRRSSVLAYLLTHRPGFRERASYALGHLGLTFARRLLSREMSLGGERLEHVLLHGMSRDRIIVLSEEYATQFLAPELAEDDRLEWKELRAAGWRIRLFSHHIEEIVLAVCKLCELQFDSLVCNRLEYRHSVATGRLQAPIVSSPVRGGHESAVRRFFIRNLEVPS